MVDTGTGTLYIIGSFKRMTTDPDFKVHTVPISSLPNRASRNFKFHVFAFPC